MVEAVARHGKIKDYGKLIAYLLKHKHYSPLEHVHFTFRIETARDISAQMMRHRSFHWQELSQRYDVIQEFMPIELRKQGKTNRQVGDEVFIPFIRVDNNCDISGLEANTYTAEYVIEQVIEDVQVLYNKLIEAGVARECARRILPMCAKTVVHMTGNLRDFLAFINVRAEAGTQKEHREIAIGIGQVLEAEFPKFKEQFPDWTEGGFM